MSDEEASRPEPDAGESVDDFDAALEAAVGEAYPVLRERVKRTQFGGWHRRRGREEDLAQEAAVKLIQHCRRHRRLPADPVGYLVSIARNLAKKQYANRATDPAEDAESLPLAFPEANGLADDEVDEETARLRSESRMELVRAGIQMLPPRQRQALELYLAEPGATQRELGQKMGLGEDAFQKNLERGIGRIRQVLQEHGLIGSPLGE